MPFKADLKWIIYIQNCFLIKGLEPFKEGTQKTMFYEHRYLKSFSSQSSNMAQLITWTIQFLP